jgi:hypothetical protein
MLVAAVKTIGSYSAGDFHFTTGLFGDVAITDLPVVNGSNVEPAPVDAFQKHGIGLPNIALGARTMLACAENAADTGGTLTASDGRHAASIALLGNYIAGSRWPRRCSGHAGATTATAAANTSESVTKSPGVSNDL